MRTCSTCGVEVEESIERCPLCGTPLEEGLPPPPTEEKKDLESRAAELKARRWLCEVIALLAATAAGIFLTIDLADDFSITWSLYPVAAVVFIWICATSVIMLGRRPVALVAALAATVLAFLFVLELGTPGRSWFLPLALPLFVLAIAVGAAAWAIVSRHRLSVFPAFAVVMLSCGLAAVGVEFILNRYLQLDRLVSWSLVALACGISLFFALLLIHKRLTERHADIRRFFHL